MCTPIGYFSSASALSLIVALMAMLQVFDCSYVSECLPGRAVLGILVFTALAHAAAAWNVSRALQHVNDLTVFDISAPKQSARTRASGMQARQCPGTAKTFLCLHGLLVIIFNVVAWTTCSGVHRCDALAVRALSSRPARVTVAEGNQRDGDRSRLRGASESLLGAPAEEDPHSTSAAVATDDGVSRVLQEGACPSKWLQLFDTCDFPGSGSSARLDGALFAVVWVVQIVAGNYTRTAHPSPPYLYTPVPAQGIGRGAAKAARALGP